MIRSTSLTLQHLKNVCRGGQGEAACSFLVIAKGGLSCAKGTDLEHALYERRERKAIHSLGDNCSGPPDFTPNS